MGQALVWARTVRLAPTLRLAVAVEGRDLPLVARLALAALVVVFVVAAAEVAP
jgi:hypothetical protein